MIYYTNLYQNYFKLFVYIITISAMFTIVIYSQQT